jgi:hypothetical protein
VTKAIMGSVGDGKVLGWGDIELVLALDMSSKELSGVCEEVLGFSEETFKVFTLEVGGMFEGV